MSYLWAYFFSTLGGAIIAGIAVKLMHWSSGDKTRGSFAALHWWVGFTERAIATTLFIWAPKQLPLFIGGWVVAKLAAGWARRKGEEAEKGHFIALVGNAVSFSVAIAAGYWVHPLSLEALNAGP